MQDHLSDTEYLISLCKSFGMAMAHITVPPYATHRSVRAYAATDRHREALEQLLGRAATPSEAIAMHEGFEEYIAHRFDQLMEKSQ